MICNFFSGLTLLSTNELYINIAIESNLPTYCQTNTPTYLPSYNPTYIPTYVPTNDPTVMPSYIPTQFPTYSPKYNPSTANDFTTTKVRSNKPSPPPTTLPPIPIQTPNTIATVTVSSSQLNEAILREWNNTGTTVFFGALAACTVLVLAIFISWKSTDQSSDKMNYFAVIRFIHQLLDAWTDLSFCAILYCQQLFGLSVFSAFCIILPYTMSILITMYYLVRWSRWKQDHPSRVKHYLKRYQFIILLVSLFGGFYSTIDLFRSKIFYLRLMYFPLKKMSIIS